MTTKMITQRKSWFVAMLAMMLLMPFKGWAYEVGDEFEVSIDGKYSKETVTNGVTLHFTVLDPTNHKVAIWKRGSSDVAVTEENLLNNGQLAVKFSSNGLYYSIPDEITAPDGEVYTISAIGALALYSDQYRYNWGIITHLPTKLEIVGSRGTEHITRLDFSVMPLLRIVGYRGLGIGTKNEQAPVVILNNLAVEEVYDSFITRDDRISLELDFSVMPKLKRIHSGAFSSWIISKRELHIPAHIEYIESGSFGIGTTFPVTDVYFDHTSASSIEWKTYSDTYNVYSLRDFPLSTTNIHVCDEILQQCKDGTRTDEFANYYRMAPSIIDPKASWQTGRGFFVKTPIGSGSVDLEYTISDYDKREVYLYSHDYQLYSFGLLDFFDETTTEPEIAHRGYTPQPEDFNSVRFGFIGYRYTHNIAYTNYNIKGTADLTIPQTVTGYDGEVYTVVGIGYNAFDGCNILNNVVLPSTVRVINGNAFNKSSIKTINLKQLVNLSYVGGSVFNETPLTGDIEFCDGVTELHGNTFTKTDITSFKSNKIKNLGICEFFDCIELTTVTLDDPLETIGKPGYINSVHKLENIDGHSIGKTFACCPKLTTVNFSNAGNLWFIGGQSFYYTGLSGTLTIPEGVTFIGGGNRTAAAYLSYSRTDRNYIYGTFVDTEITKVIYPSTLIYDSGSFDNFEVSTRQDIRCVLQEADLSKCSNLKAMEYTFRGCNLLSKVTLPNSGNLKEINDVFYDCTSITGELVIPEGVESCCNNNNMGVTKITYPKSVKEIGAAECKNLTTVNFSDLENLTSIKGFNNCNLQGEISLCSKVRDMLGYYSQGAFYNNPGITKVIFPAMPAYFEGSNFIKCTGITDVYIKRYDSMAGGLTDTDNENYLSMNGPTGTKIHVSQRIIDECKAGTDNGFLEWYNANPDCLVPYDEASLPTGTSLKVNLPLYNEEGTENGETATVLFNIIDSDKREIGVFNPYSYNYDEENYSEDINIYVGYPADENFLYHGDGKYTNWCVSEMTGEGILILPETMTLRDGHTYTLSMIGTGAFQGYYNYNYVNYKSPTYKNLLGILMPRTIKRIGDYAFSANNKLGFVMFDETFGMARGKQVARAAATEPLLEHIGKYAFQGLNYPVVDFSTLPNLKVIDDYAFRYTEGYGESLNLGKTVEVIGEEAFANAKLKGTVELPASLKLLKAKAFYDNNDVTRVNFNNLNATDLKWEGSGDKSENFSETTVVGAAQGILDQCASGVRFDQFKAYYPDQLVSLGGEGISIVIDLNGDGKMDADDLVKLFDIIIGKEPYSAKADLNGDGVVNISDMIILAAILARK